MGNDYIQSSHSISSSSDERLKTIYSNVDLDINDIANTRIVDYSYNNDDKSIHHVGAIAQDWKEVLP